MTSPLDLARRYTGLDSGGRAHLARLMATWGLLADLSFSDLLLYVPVDEFSLVDSRDDVRPAPGGGEIRGLHFVVLGQIRPTTSQTLLEQDLVGQVVVAAAVPFVVDAWREGIVTRSQERADLADGLAEVECVPVRWRGEVVAVLRRTWSQSAGRRQGQLEVVYLELFGRFASMIVAVIL